MSSIAVCDSLKPLRLLQNSRRSLLSAFTDLGAFDINPLLLGVCGFTSNVQSQQNRSKINQADSFATASFIFLFGGMMAKHDWTLEELRALYKEPLLDLIYRASHVHRKHHNAREVQLCHLVSVKTGGCSEDCKYCAQSSRYQTDVMAEPLMDIEEVMQRARDAKEKGSSRICLGAAWRKVRNNQQFETILKMVQAIDAMGLEVCCTLGMLTDEQAKKLKQAGLYAYNHNLDTSDRYYKKIITTRTYLDRLHTLAAVRDANVSVCCGGIIGLGEEIEDRIRLIQTLASFNPHPESVPINRLVPIQGTPLGEQKPTSVWDLLRTIAVCRIAMPTSMVRIAAGREKMTHAEQSLCF